MRRPRTRSNSASRPFVFARRRSEIVAGGGLGDDRVRGLHGLLRQVQPERRALAHLRLERHGAAVALHDLLDDVQAEAGAADAAGVAAALEAAEQARAVLLGDADAVV